MHQKVIEEYEHLDVIWAIDCMEKVGKEVKEVLWKTCDVRDKVRVPMGCEDVEKWEDPKGNEGAVASDDEGQSSSSDER